MKIISFNDIMAMEQRFRTTFINSIAVGSSLVDTDTSVVTAGSVIISVDSFELLPPQLVRIIKAIIIAPKTVNPFFILFTF